MVAEGIHQLAGARVEGVKDVVAGVEEPAVAAIFALPIIDAAVGNASGSAVVVNPNFLAGLGVEGDRSVIFPHHVHHAVDHDRVEAVTEAVVAIGIEPDLLELSDIRFIDLLQGRVLSRVRAAFIVAPRGIRLGVQMCIRDRVWGEPVICLLG